MSDSARLFLPFDEGLLELPERALYIRPDADLPDAISDLICEQGFRPTYDRLITRGFRIEPQVSGDFPAVFVGLTRSRAENMANIARACRMGALVVVSGAKTDGIDSLLKALKKICPVDGVLSKSHGKVFWLTPSTIPDWSLTLSKNAAGFETAPGMFSPDKIDHGSAALVEYFDGSIKGTVADLGAGWGYLSAELLKRCEKITELHLFEADYAALEAAKRNVAKADAFNWADVPALEKPREGYQTVISNPPFHQGRAAEPEIGANFIKAAARILRPSGQLLMVANRQLPYEKTLDLHFKHWEILYQGSAYKIVRARRPVPLRG